MEEGQGDSRGHAGEDAESKFAYPAGEEPMYRDHEGHLLTPDEFWAHLARDETAGEREARYRHAQEVQRRLLGVDAPPEAREPSESSEDRSHGPRRSSEG